MCLKLVRQKLIKFSWSKLITERQWFQTSILLRLLFQSELSHRDLRERCIGLVATQRHSPHCVKSFSPDRRGESWIIDVPRAGRACGNLPFLDLPRRTTLPFLSRVVRGSYFVRLTRMDRHNFSANSSIRGRSARKRAWQNTEDGICVSTARLSRSSCFHVPCARAIASPWITLGPSTRIFQPITISVFWIENWRNTNVKIYEIELFF